MNNPVTDACYNIEKGLSPVEPPDTILSPF